jgi:hypothetical protein
VCIGAICSIQIFFSLATSHPIATRTNRWPEPQLMVLILIKIFTSSHRRGSLICQRQEQHEMKSARPRDRAQVAPTQSSLLALGRRARGIMRPIGCRRKKKPSHGGAAGRGCVGQQATLAPDQVRTRARSRPLDGAPDCSRLEHERRPILTGEARTRREWGSLPARPRGCIYGCC